MATSRPHDSGPWREAAEHRVRRMPLTSFCLEYECLRCGGEWGLWWDPRYAGLGLEELDDYAVRWIAGSSRDGVCPLEAAGRRMIPGPTETQAPDPVALDITAPCCHLALVRLGQYLGVNDWAVPPEMKLEWLQHHHDAGHPVPLWPLTAP